MIAVRENGVTLAPANPAVRVHSSHPATEPAKLTVSLSLAKLRCRVLAWTGICATALSFNIGCESPDPGADIQRAHNWVHERTGSADVYDPQAEAQVEQRVEAWLAGGTITVDQAVSIALLNNRNLQGSFERIGISRADLAQSQLISNPSLSLGLFFPEAGGRSKFQVGLAQQIAELWQLPVRKQIAEIHLEQTIREVAQQAIDLKADVHRTCYELIMLKEVSQIVEQNLKLAQEAMELIQQRFAQGQGSRIEVNLAKEEALQAEVDRINVYRDIELAKSDLRELLGISGHSKPWELAGELPAPIMPVDEAGLMEQAERQRFDVQVATYEVQLAEAGLKEEYLKVLRSIEVGVEAERTDRRAMPGHDVLASTARESLANGQLTPPSLDTPAERDAARRQEIDWTIGPLIDIELPLFDQNQAQIAKVRRVMLQKRKAHEALLQTVAKQVQRSATVLRSNQQLINFYRQKLLPLATSNMEDSRSMYQVGQSEVFSVIDSQRSLLKRRREYVGVLRDYAVALADLEWAIGGVSGRAPASAPAATGPA